MQCTDAAEWEIDKGRTEITSKANGWHLDRQSAFWRKATAANVQRVVEQYDMVHLLR